MKDALGHGSNAHAASALASGPKSVPAPIHSAMGIPERLVGAAYKVGGEVFQAPIHALALEDAVAKYPNFKPSAADHGQFLTSTGRMVRRNEATEIAKAARQLNGKPMLHGGSAIDSASVNYRRPR